MSYDLLVFDPDAAPSERTAFLAWFEAQSEWSEPHSYEDPAVASPRLQAWFREMIQTFPPLNGEDATTDYDDPRVADYSIGTQLIYVGFGWSQVEPAYEAVHRLAGEHGLGFYDVSSEAGAVWLPNEGSLWLLHSEP